MARIRSLTCALAALALASPASAFDIGSVDVLWLYDVVDGVPITDPHGIEIVVNMVDDSDLQRIDVTTPAGGIGTFSLVDLGGGEYEIDFAQTSQFASSALLLSSYPTDGANPWTIDFIGTGTGSVEDTISVILNQAPVTDTLDGFTPADGATNVPTNQQISWNDCSACDGSRIILDLIDVGTDTDINAFTTTNLSTTSWDPGPLPGGATIEMEAILGNYDFFETTETTATLGDSYTLLAGYESINIITFSTQPVPEPGTGLLVGFGLVGLALRRRVRR